MRPESKWTNPKHPNKVFVGKYERSDKSNTRIFVLKYKVNGVVDFVEIYESHEKAKDAQWVKVK